jgi:hypothetical protein
MLAFLEDLTNAPDAEMKRYNISNTHINKKLLQRLLLRNGGGKDPEFIRDAFNGVANGGDLVQAVALLQLGRATYRRAHAGKAAASETAAEQANVIRDLERDLQPAVTLLTRVLAVLSSSPEAYTPPTEPSSFICSLGPSVRK